MKDETLILENYKTEEELSYRGIELEKSLKYTDKKEYWIYKNLKKVYGM